MFLTSFPIKYMNLLPFLQSILFLNLPPFELPDDPSIATQAEHGPFPCGDGSHAWPYAFCIEDTPHARPCSCAVLHT